MKLHIQAGIQLVQWHFNARNMHQFQFVIPQTVLKCSLNHRCWGFCDRDFSFLTNCDGKCRLRSAIVVLYPRPLILFAIILVRNWQDLIKVYTYIHFLYCPIELNSAKLCWIERTECFIIIIYYLSRTFEGIRRLNLSWDVHWEVHQIRQLLRGTVQGSRLIQDGECYSFLHNLILNCCKCQQ